MNIRIKRSKFSPQLELAPDSPSSIHSGNMNNDNGFWRFHSPINNRVSPRIIEVSKIKGFEKNNENTSKRNHLDDYSSKNTNVSCDSVQVQSHITSTLDKTPMSFDVNLNDSRFTPNLAGHQEMLRRSLKLAVKRKQESNSLSRLKRPYLNPIKEHQSLQENKTLTRFIDGMILKGDLPLEATEFFRPTNKTPVRLVRKLDPLPNKEKDLLSKSLNQNISHINHTTQSNTDYINQDLSIIPSWMKEISEFPEKYANKRMKSKYPVYEILSRDPMSREDVDSNFVCKWLEKIDLFMKFPYDLLLALSKRLKTLFLQEGEVLCKVGDPADCSYIIYDGRVDILIPDKEGGERWVATAKSGELLGRQALETVGVRNAKLKASKQSYIIVLYQNDYQEVSGEIRSLIRPTQAIYDFIMKHSFLKQFSDIQKLSFMNRLEFRKLYKNDVVYKTGDQADHFYFLMSGNVLREIPVTKEKVNKWPTGLYTWKMFKKLSSYSIKIVMEEGDIFGLLEFMEDIPRKEKIIAEGDALILSCSKSVFYDTFEKYELSYFLKRAREDEKAKNDKLAEAFEVQSKINKIKDEAMAEALRHAPVSKSNINPSQVVKIKEWKRAVEKLTTRTVRDKKLLGTQGISKELNSVYET